MTREEVWTALEVLGITVAVVSAMQKVTKVQWLPWKAEYGIYIGIILGALGMWLKGGWFPLPG